MSEARSGLDRVTLAGRHVTLVPLSPTHEGDLREAVADGAVWRAWYSDVPSPDAMADAIARRLSFEAAGTMLLFTVFDNRTGRPAGVTTFRAIDLTVPRVEIGATWLASSAQRTGINTEAKRLLLRHAFERVDCAAVEIRTHVLNHTSRRAIERLGARLDGIPRADRRMANGTIRDSCVYSITRAEWPAVSVHLDRLLARWDENTAEGGS